MHQCIINNHNNNHIHNMGNNNLEQVMKEYNESLKELRDVIMRIESRQSFMGKQIESINKILEDKFKTE